MIIPAPGRKKPGGIVQALDPPGSDTYIFRHALVREAAAASLLKTTRAEYENRIAQVQAGSRTELVPA